jgi:hypothetical protein
MRTTYRIVFLLIFTIIISSALPERLDYRKGRYNNVCKSLRNEVLLYYVFIDSRETSPWTEFDIISTIDSIGVAVQWLNQQAEKNKIELRIKTEYFIGNEFATVNRNLPKGTVYESFHEPNLKTGLASLNKWADYVSRIIGESFYVIEKDGIPLQQAPRDAERLIAHLRDEFSVESVVLMFMVNNYFRSDISIALNTFDTENVEYCIVSYKYPSEIAHNFLRLYGAADLYETAFRRSKSKIKLANALFENEIMQDSYAKNIWNQDISDFTCYLIGWTEEIPEQYEPLLTDRILK